MAMSARGKRRLTILLLVVVALGAGITGLYFWRQAQRQQAAQLDRQQGMAAYKAGNHADAVVLLGEYLDYESDDPEAQYAYALANLKSPQPDGAHVRRALRGLQRVVELQPDHPTAGRDLLEMHLVLGNDSQALSLADELLAADPQNLAAYRARATTLARMERPTEALEAAQAGLEIDPLDWRLRMRSLQLQHELGTPAQELIEQVRQLREAHPDDPRFEMLQALTYGFAGENQEMARWLQSAAQRTPPGEEFVSSMLRFLDGLNLYGQSLALLERAAGPGPDAPLYDELLRRLFEAGQYQDLAQRLQGIDPAAPQVEPLHVALRAMALHELGRQDEARPLVEALAQRKHQPAAHAWANVLEAVYGSDAPGQSSRIIDAAREALQTYAANPYFNFFLGRAYAEAGESQLALPAWQRAAQLRPSWSAPHVQRAQVLLNMGKLAEAREAAEAGFVRQPGGVNAAVVYATARAAALGSGGSDDSIDEVLAMLDEIQRVVPEEEQTRLLEVALLGRAGRTAEAADAARAMLAGNAALSERSLLRLAELSRQHDLGLAAPIEQRMAARAELSPQAAVAQATQLAEQGQPDEGRSLIEAQLAKAQQPQDRLRWQVARARYLEAIASPDAAQAWIEIADAYPDDPQIQQLALRQRSVVGHREFTARAIERLRETLGENSVVWRQEHARWLLSGPEAQRDPARASSLLREVITMAPDDVEPRLLLAQAQEQLGLLPLAIRELRAAAQLRPDSAAIALELARLNQSMRHFRSARTQLEQVIDNPDAAPEQRRRAAAMLARQGEDQAALRVLEDLHARGATRSTEDALLLAHLYQRTGQSDRADAIVRDLLEKPTVGIIAFAADYYAAQGRPEEAQRVLAMAGQLDLPPGQHELLLGGHYARTGRQDEALKHFQAATEAAPEDASAWRRLIAFQLTLGEPDAALAAADRAAQAAGSDPALDFFREHGELVRQFGRDPQLRPLVAALIGDSGERGPAADALQVIAQVRQRGEPAVQAARRLQPLAEQNPGSLELQNLLAQLYLDAGRPDDAAAVALRAMESFPTAVEPAWLAAQALAAAERWDQALLTARQWRQRSASQAMRADMMIAEARLRLGDASHALQTLEPYLEDALANPDEHAEVITGYARSLIAAGRFDQAAQLLEPMLDRSAQWRAEWMRLAALALPDAQRAQQWLEQVSAKVPQDNVQELASLAQSWWVLAERLDAPGFRDRARQIVERVVQQPDASAHAWYLQGVMADYANDLPTARHSYEQALERDPNLPAAQNNLAMILAKNPARLEEAIQLARQAVAAQPSSPHFLDTLASVEAQAGNCETAIEHMETAIQLDPHNPQWRANLAQILAACGKEDQATELLQQLPANSTR